MSLPPHIGRPLFRALISAANGLQHELSHNRGAILRSRELDRLRVAAASPLPKELRGLLDIKQSSSKQLDLSNYITTCARRLIQASYTPQFENIDSIVGFTALKHMNERINALRHLVYSTTSDAEKHGIRVEVESSYQGADRERYFFRYQVRIINVSSETVQLISRAWTIRDLDGRVISVEGPGVVGAFPTLAPRESYQYSSAVPLHTPMGTQSGHYVFILQDDDPMKEQEQLSNKILHVPVAPFSYRSPSMDGKKTENFISPSSTSINGKVGRRKKRSDDYRRR